MENMVINMEISVDLPKYNGYGVTHPDILFIKNGFKGYKYWLFYTPYPPNEAENPCLVRSNDGFSFTENGIDNPVVSIKDRDVGIFEKDHLADPDVLFHNRELYLFYTGVGLSTIDDHTISNTKSNFGQSEHICMVKSEDGINWSRASNKPIIGNAMEPSVVRDNNAFKMWFARKERYDINEGIPSIYKSIWITESNDLFNWSSPVKVFEWDQNVGHPDVIKNGDRYEMHFVKTDLPIIHWSTHTAISDDGHKWKIDDSIVSFPSIAGPRTGTYRSSSCLVGDSRITYMSHLRNTPIHGISVLVGDDVGC
jgi:hypothetical protein